MKKNTLNFKSLKEEREFWGKHSPFDVLDEKEWKIQEKGAITLKSIYTSCVGKRGVFIYLPKEILKEMDVKEGERLKVWKDGNHLTIEAYKEEGIVLR
ncbi:MAG: AbrB/MazE/SpoVT family DNA-binding domain-containing protein [bacterium]